MPAERFDEELPAELKAIEIALRDLPPSLGQLDRDRLMYLAGQASAANLPLPVPRRIAWPLATAALALVSFTLGGVMMSGKRGEQLIVHVDQPIRSSSAEVSISEDGRSSRTMAIGQAYFELRDLVLTKGLDAMPMPETTNEKSDLVDSLSWPALRDELLRGNIGG